MMREAESHAEEDKQARERVEAHNKLDGLIYSTEKTLSENKEKVDSSTISEIESAVTEAKTKIESQSASEINAAYDRLIKSTHKLAEAMYKQASKTSADPSGPSDKSSSQGAGDGDDVIDAEYVDVDDKK